MPTGEQEYVGFSLQKEDWTLFELPDGAILKAKFVLATVRREKGTIGEYLMKSQNVVAMILPNKYIGTSAPHTYTKRETVAAVEEDWVEEIKTKTPDQWNVYRLDDGAVISVKLELLGAGRTSLFDPRGERLYAYNLQPIVRIKIPPELRKKVIEKQNVET